MGLMEEETGEAPEAETAVELEAEMAEATAVE